jgi:hypothetical protein
MFSSTGNNRVKIDHLMMWPVTFAKSYETLRKIRVFGRFDATIEKDHSSALRRDPKRSENGGLRYHQTRYRKKARRVRLQI